MQEPSVSIEEETELKRQYMVALQRQKAANELPIFAKHNPYNGGAFNGNDCMRLLAKFRKFTCTIDLLNKKPNSEAVTRSTVLHQAICFHF